ncbi:MAG: chemotaxis protein CheW [Gemmatimonadaceae bacterium]
MRGWWTPTRSTSLDSTTPTLEPTATPTLLFRVGDVVYGCDIGDAQEILPLRPATRLPGAPPYVRGLINVRGTIVTLLDVAARLEPGRALVETGSILLIRYRERLVGLAVEEVVDVRELDVDTSGAAGGTVNGGAALTRGVATADGATVVVLDVEALIRQVLLS